MLFTINKQGIDLLKFLQQGESLDGALNQIRVNSNDQIVITGSIDFIQTSLSAYKEKLIEQKPQEHWLEN